MGWFKRAVCVHVYDNLGDLKDNEQNPTSIKRCLMCTLCGHTVEHTFTAPPKAGVCNHQWRDKDATVIKDRWGGKTDQTKMIQQCAKCGEYRNFVV